MVYLWDNDGRDMKGERIGVFGLTLRTPIEHFIFKLSLICFVVSINEFPEPRPEDPADAARVQLVQPARVTGPAAAPSVFRF